MPSVTVQLTSSGSMPSWQGMMHLPHREVVGTVSPNDRYESMGQNLYTVRPRLPIQTCVKYQHANHYYVRLIAVFEGFCDSECCSK